MVSAKRLFFFFLMDFALFVVRISRNLGSSVGSLGVEILGEEKGED